MRDETEKAIDNLVENMRGMDSLHMWDVLRMIREKSELDLVMRSEGKTPIPIRQQVMNANPFTGRK